MPDETAARELDTEGVSSQLGRESLLPSSRACTSFFRARSRARCPSTVWLAGGYRQPRGLERALRPGDLSRAGDAAIRSQK